MDFVENFLLFPALQIFWKSVGFDKVTESLEVRTLFETQRRLDSGINTAGKQKAFDIRRSAWKANVI